MYQTARLNEQVVVPKFGLPNVHYDQAHWLSIRSVSWFKLWKHVNCSCFLKGQWPGNDEGWRRSKSVLLTCLQEIRNYLKILFFIMHYIGIIIDDYHLIDYHFASAYLNSPPFLKAILLKKTCLSNILRKFLLGIPEIIIEPCTKTSCIVAVDSSKVKSSRKMLEISSSVHDFSGHDAKDVSLCILHKVIYSHYCDNLLRREDFNFDLKLSLWPPVFLLILIKLLLTAYLILFSLCFMGVGGKHFHFVSYIP